MNTLARDLKNVLPLHRSTADGALEGYYPAFGKIPQSSNGLSLQPLQSQSISAPDHTFALETRWAEVKSRQQVRLRVRIRLRELLMGRGVSFALGKLEKQQKEER